MIISISETKYFYDNKEHGQLLKGDLTKTEIWLDTGGGNPTTYYTYDSFGNLIKQTDALGRTTTYDYGLMDITHTYPERITNALGHATDFEYDIATGNILSATKNGITFYSKYDVFGRIIKEILPYDTSNLPTKTYTYNYDGTAPEIIKVSQKTTANNTLDIYYYYDGFANLVQIKTPAEEGQVVKNIFYDGLFRVKEEQNPYFFSSSANLANISNTVNKTRYNYDALGRIIQVTNPDGTIKRITYNHSEINDYDENNNRHTYLLDSYDRIIAVTEYNQDYYLLDNETYNTTYSYNGADELIGIRDTYGNHFNFTYDSLGRKIKLNDPDLGTWKYEYDFAGNLISQIGGGGNLITGDNYYREYNGLGQLIRVRDGNTATGNILEEYFYDSNGDRIKIYRYSYSGGTNETIYTPYKEWMQIKNSSGTFNFYYIYQSDTLVTRLNADGTKYYYHNDHLGSTSLITDQNGNVVENELYSPFAESLSTNNAEENKLYTGQFKDSTGMYYYGARYYMPQWGIFVMPDPEIQNVYDSQFLNHYSYARNNPYLFVDPDGRNARVYLDKEGARIPLFGYQGHISVGIDDPNNKNMEIIFENTGLQPYRDRWFNSLNTEDSEKYRQFLSIWGVHDAETFEYSREIKRDKQGKIELPKNYDDYFEIEQDEPLDIFMITAGRELNSKPWKYQAWSYNSQHYAGKILEAAGYKVDYGYNPIKTFEQNKDKKWVSSAYKVVSGEKRYVVWNNGQGRATGNAYCKKGCK